MSRPFQQPSKRRLAEAPGDAAKAPRKRMRARAEDHSPKPVSSADEAASSRACPMGLPVELRLQVYEHLLDDMLAPVQHPYDEYRHHRFKPYVNLLLSCRTVHDELRPLFENESASRLVFYFDEASSLVRLVWEWADNPIISNACFCIRAWSGNEDEASDEQCEHSECVQMLIDDQAFFTPDHYLWINIENMYNVTVSPGYVRPRGCVRTKNHSHAHCHNRRTCKPYTTLKWPKLSGNNCRVTTCQWSTRGNINDVSGTQRSLMFMEGRLRDLRFGSGTFNGLRRWHGEDHDREHFDLSTEDTHQHSDEQPTDGDEESHSESSESVEDAQESGLGSESGVDGDDDLASEDVERSNEEASDLELESESGASLDESGSAHVEYD